MRLPRVKIKVGRKAIVKHGNQTSYQEFKHEFKHGDFQLPGQRLKALLKALGGSLCQAWMVLTGNRWEKRGSCMSHKKNQLYRLRNRANKARQDTALIFLGIFLL